jgi:hypothetical protein
MTDQPDERYLTAHHEAGHAVAALLRGAELTSITIDPTPERAGYTGFRGKRWDSQFFTYAGPWAEARSQWTEDSLDGVDDDGCLFGDYVVYAFLVNRAIPIGHRAVVTRLSG